MALDLTKPSRIANAVNDTLASRQWAAADSEDRVLLMTLAVCDALCPLVPRGEAVRRELQQIERNREIRESFDGRNYEELAGRFGRSSRQIRRIVDEPRKSKSHA